MERESFKDDEVAALLNRDFIAIKVDREERPDIDNIYMNVCQALTGRGGWPLTVIMTPDKKPFFAATYLPRSSRQGLIGMTELLPRIKQLWDTERETVLESSEGIASWLQKSPARAAGHKLDEEVFARALEYYRKNFDSNFGGFGQAPKFPSPHQLYFLLRYHHLFNDETALKMVEKTLESMYRGGIYDHIGFGFARYSTDRFWLAPHFEKMLYDNALLAIAYLEAYQLTGKELFARAAREIFNYILRDMTSPEGAFYSAEDADSEGEEGKFYLWTVNQVKEVLGEEDGRYFCQVYDITDKGNFEGKNIPNLTNGLPWEVDSLRLEGLRKRLFMVREARIHPFKDDKILCSWNALMIAALAYGARVLNDGSYLKAGRRAADFILTRLRRPDGRLLASYREGEANHPAYVDDYAYLVWAMIELYESGFENRFLKAARDLNEELLRYFWDEENGGLFFYGSDGEELLTRNKEFYDGALPSGNSVAALNFLRLARLTAAPELEEKAERQLQAFAGEVNAMPAGFSFFLCAALYARSQDRQIVIAGSSQNPDTREMLDAARKTYNPFSVTVFKEEREEQQPGNADWPDYLAGMHSIDGRPAAYICNNFTCQQPVTSAGELARQLQRV